MNDINNINADNFAGLQKIWFTGVKGLLQNDLVNGILLKGSEKWIQMYLTPGSASFKEEKKEGKHGKTYKVDLIGIIPKDSPELSKEIDHDDRFLIIYKDNNDYFKFIGDKDIGLKLQVTLDTGGWASDINAHLLHFTGTLTEKSRFIDDSFLNNNQEWILATGFWNDLGKWIDTAIWID